MEKRLSDIDPSSIEYKKITDIIKNNKTVFESISKISKDFTTESKAVLFTNILVECSKKNEFPFLFTMGTKRIEDAFTTVTNIQDTITVIEVLESIIVDKKERMENGK